MKAKKEVKTLGFNGLLDVQKRFPTEQSCRDYLAKSRWNGSMACPHCGSMDRVSKYSNGKTLFCGDCRRQFTVKVGTIFEDSSLPLQKWFFAIFLMTAHKKGISSCQLARDIGVTQKTAWFMTQRIRHAMKTKSALKPMKNTVEADETYVGGKRHKGKPGRGSENKTPVFGLVEREKGEVRSMPVENVKRETLTEIIQENVSPTATIMTDEWRAYKGLAKKFRGHKVINHSAGRYARKDVHVNTIENFWSLLKRGIIGIYHHVSKGHLHRYCDEFQFRYNSRESGDANRFEKMLGSCEGRLTYNALIGQTV